MLHSCYHVGMQQLLGARQLNGNTTTVRQRSIIPYSSVPALNVYVLLPRNPARRLLPPVLLCSLCCVHPVTCGALTGLNRPLSLCEQGGCLHV
jgi:hypothetical protein